LSSREPPSTGRGRRRLTATETDLSVVQQRALLVGTGFGARSLEAAEESLVELALLAARRGPFDPGVLGAAAAAITYGVGTLVGVGL